MGLGNSSLEGGNTKKFPVKLRNEIKYHFSPVTLIEMMLPGVGFCVALRHFIHSDGNIDTACGKAFGYFGSKAFHANDPL